MRCKIWEPEDCLCGFESKKATVIVGWFNFVFSVTHVVHMLCYTPLQISVIKFKCHLFEMTKSLDQDDCAMGVVTAIAITSLTSAMTAFASAILLWGVRKRNPNHVLFYLFVKTFTIAFYGMITAVLLIYIFMIWMVHWVPVALFLGFLGIYLDVFFLLNVRLFYRKLRYPHIYRVEEEQHLPELPNATNGGDVNQRTSLYSSQIVLTDEVGSVMV